MTFVYDKDDVLALYLLQLPNSLRQVFCIHSAHLLYGGHDKRTPCALIFEFIQEDSRIVGILHFFAVASEATIVLQALAAQFDAVDEEDHLICIARSGNELSGFEARHRLARACGMPDIATLLYTCVPIVFGHTSTDGIGGIILIATKHF